MDISRLQPFDVGQMQRIGSRNDGGYVIPTQIPPIDLLISFGLGDNWSFEKMAEKLNSLLFELYKFLIYSISSLLNFFFVVCISTNFSFMFC